MTQATVYCFECDNRFRPDDAEMGVWWRGECPRCEAPLSDEDFEEPDHD